MADINLSSATQGVIQKQKETNLAKTQPIESNKPTEIKKIDKKKLACGIAAAIGVAALAATVIHFAKKPNASEFEKGIKKFFNGESLIDGVKLEKGKAINPDGSMFTGVMKTMNDKGEEIALEYTDGYIASSTKNGKLFKTFENITQNEQTLSRSNAVRITKFDENGKVDKIFEQAFYPNGKIKRTINSSNAFDFYESGKLKAKEIRWSRSCDSPKTLDDISQFHSAKIYDEQGNLVKEIKGLGADGKVIKLLPNGNKVELSSASSIGGEKIQSLTGADDIVLDCKKATFYKKQGDEYIKSRTIEYESGQQGNTYNVSDFESLNGKPVIKNTCRIIPESYVNGTSDNGDYIYHLSKKNGLSLSKTKGEDFETISDPQEKQAYFTKIRDYITQVMQDAKEQNIIYCQEMDKPVNSLLSEVKI